MPERNSYEQQDADTVGSSLGPTIALGDWAEQVCPVDDDLLDSTTIPPVDDDEPDR